MIPIGRKALRCPLARRSVTSHRAKTSKESTDPGYDAKLAPLAAAPHTFRSRLAD